MNKRKRFVAVTALLLILALGAMTRAASSGHVRAVDFLAIFAAGMLAGSLITQVAIARAQRAGDA
jgi:hypothetical protein